MNVIHIYEDSRDRIWFGTFGGGLNHIQVTVNSSGTPNCRVLQMMLCLEFLKTETDFCG